MHRLKLKPLISEIKTEPLPAVGARDELITVTVPLTALFARSYTYYYESHGCTIARAGENLYRFTFPLGTRAAQRESGYLLTLPDRTCIDVTPTREGQCSLHIHGNPAPLSHRESMQQEGGAL